MWCPERAAIVDAWCMPEPFSTTCAVYIEDCEVLMVGCRSSVVRALPAFFPFCLINSNLAFILTIVKVIHVHLVLRKTLVWKDQQSFYLILPIFICVCQISIHCFIIELQYNHVLTL